MLDLGLFCSFSRFLEGNLEYWFEMFPFPNICIFVPHIFLLCRFLQYLANSEVMFSSSFSSMYSFRENFFFNLFTLFNFVWAGSSSLWVGLLSLWCAGFSSCGSPAPEHRLTSCDAQAWLPHSMWNLPGPGIELMSFTLAGWFLTTRLPGTSSLFFCRCCF